MDDQDSLYLLLNGFMYPLSYQRTALYGGDACHSEKEIRMYFSDVYIRLQRRSILNFHFRTDKKLTWLVHVIIKYSKQYLRACRSTSPYTSYTPLHCTILLYTPALHLYQGPRAYSDGINKPEVYTKESPNGPSSHCRRRQSPCQQAQVMINVLECSSRSLLVRILSGGCCCEPTLSSGRNVLGILAQTAIFTAQRSCINHKFKMYKSPSIHLTPSLHHYLTPYSFPPSFLIYTFFGGGDFSLILLHRPY